MYNLKIAFRNLRRNGVYSVINISGLAVSLAVAILIFLWVVHERSYDRYHNDADRIYIITHQSDNERKITDQYVLQYVLGETIKKEIPEIEGVIPFQITGISGMKVNNQVFSVNESANIDPHWFETFHYDLIEGSFETFSANPFSVVLTRSESKRLFGDRSAVGQTITINHEDYIVQAVVEDNPSNSIFQYNLMMNTAAIMNGMQERPKAANMATSVNNSRNISSDATPAEQERANLWERSSFGIFLKLRNDANVDEVNQKISDVYGKNSGFTNNTFQLHPLSMIHFEMQRRSLFPTINPRTLSTFSWLAILLLVTACINYVNLATARANMRFKEVGVKKIVGARRRSLFMQFITESFLVSIIAVSISLLIIWVLSPWYNQLVENASFSFSSPVIWIASGIVALLSTILNGIYPAFMLSSFQPMNIFSGKSVSGIKSGSLRKILVVVQMILSSGLIISIIIIFQQMQYIQNMNPGYDKEQVAHVRVPVEKGGEAGVLTMQSFKAEVESLPNITSVALCDFSIMHVGSISAGGADWDGRNEDFNPMMSVINVDADYLQTLGLSLTEGRWFEKGNIADESNVILNETAVQTCEISDPIEKRFDFNGMKGKIIGVVKDFNFRSVHEKITPIVITNSPDGYYMIAIKTQPGKSVKAVQSVEKIWKGFFPDDPFTCVFLDDTFNRIYKSDIKTSRLMLIFSVLTVIIAMLGLFGLSTFSIQRRTKEIGIRKTLGASISNIVKLLFKEFLWLVIAAFVISIPIAWWIMTKWLDNFA